MIYFYIESVLYIVIMLLLVINSGDDMTFKTLKRKSPF